MIIQRLIFLLKRIGLVLALYTVSRALFCAFNFQSYQQAGWQELLSAFLVGLRYDIAAICRTNAGFIILAMLPFPLVDKNWYQKLLKFVFLASNIPFLVLNVVDFEYHKFNGQRSSLSLLDMGHDIPNQIGQLSLHYWYLAAISGIFILVLWRFLSDRKPTLEKSPRSPAVWARDGLIFVTVIALAIIGGRGGWQRRRLTTALAQVGDQESLTQLALNSTYTLINSQQKCDGMSPIQYFASDAEIKRQFPPKNILERKSDRPFTNVVLIIVESLSAEYTGIGNAGPSYTPFLDSLARRGLYFKNGFADGRRSIDAPPSILAGLPHLRDETFFCAQFKRLRGVGSILKERGYNTSFFHGGKNGTMSFDVFSRRMGFDDYYGLNEYPRPEDSDGIWGIYDEPFMQYFAQQLAHRPQPFITVVFTLSTHNPYKVPAQYQGVLPEGELPIHRTVAYFDHALKRFFETAEKMPWYSNTLFVITGDHVGPPKTILPRMIDNYRVPIVFFHPGGELPAVSPDKIVQHVDIEPSVLDYLGVATNDTLPFGHSIFDASYEGLAFGQKAGNYWIADKENYLEFHPNGPSKLFALAHLDEPIKGEVETKTRLETKLKAYTQWFNNGLVNDTLYR